MEALSLSRRWITFNGVGLLGLAVQLGAVAVLVHGLGVHYMPATVMAVEAAVLHNFVWHQRWTFKQSGLGVARRTILKRLIRFHVLNGTVSLFGNVIIMGGLTGILGMEPVAANLVAVLACSIVNFFACDMLVFRTTLTLLAVLVLSATTNAGAPPEIPAAELRSPTLAAWQGYERKVDERYGRLAAGSGTFFAHDEYKRPAPWRAAVRTGNIGMFQIESAVPGAPELKVPDGKIHHWAGAVFIPGATLEGVLGRLRENAGREAGAYEDVLASRLLSSDGDRLQVFLKLRRQVSLVTVTYNTEHAVEYRRLGSTRATSRSVATKISELTDDGGGEREKPPGKDSGYLWRLNAYWRYEQVDGGVLLECESVSLSRSVPFVLRPFITGVVEGVARESLEKTLRSLRTVLVRST